MITEDGDFRMVLDCFSALGDEKLGEDYRVLAALLIFYNELNSFDDLALCSEDLEELVNGMYKFFNCGQDKSPGAETEHTLIDWDGDSQMICSAINNVAKLEIRSLPYLHWWTFMGYYGSVGESVLSTVVGIRNKIVKHKKLEKWEQEFKKSNPSYFHWKSTSVKDRETEDLIRELWNQGGVT
jgi:hypothetical protein